jgi:adenosylcobinamide-GDP ribazoletransferase
MRPLVHELRLLLVALQFLTRVPVPRWVGYEPAWLHASARHFPAVGLIVGAVSALVLWSASLCWPLPVAVGLAMAASLWLTGGFHEDGLADTCDGLGGAVSRERALAIMKDSRLGSYGALGLVMVLGLKAAALHGLGSRGVLQAAVPALLFAHAASRSAAVMLLASLPYAGDAEHAKAKPMAQQVSGAGMAVALAWPVAIGGVLLGVAAARPLLTSAVACMVAALVCRRWFMRRLGGYTGDTLGATQQLSELAIYLAWLAAA